MPVRYYQIHGVGIEVQSSDDRLERLVHGCLFPYTAEEISRPALSLVLRWEKRDWLVPTQARRFLHYGALRGFALDGWRYFTDYLSYLIIEPGHELVQGYLCEDSLRENGERVFVNLLFTITLFEALRHQGLFFLHAAGLLSPEQEGYLFAANAYSGKTSITLALLQQGFRYLSDDTVFLRRAPEGIEVLPWARAFHVPAELSQVYPELKKLADRPDSIPFHSKKELPLDQCYPGRQTPRLLNPAWLFFPAITAEPHSRLVPLGSGQALPLLLPQSLAVMFDREHAADHLQALKQLLATARSFRLLSGTDIKADPGRLLAVLKTARTPRDAGGGKP